DVLQRLPGERVVEVDSDAARTHRGHDPALPADGDFHPDLGIDLLSEELPLRLEFHEPRIANPRALLRGDDHLFPLADLRSDEGRVEAFEEPPLPDDHRALDVDLLLFELALFLRDFVMRCVEEGLPPVRVHRPGVVLEPDDVSLLNRVRGHPLTAGCPGKSPSRLKIAGFTSPCRSRRRSACTDP